MNNLPNFTLAEIESAAAFIYQSLTPTPQISWPLLNERCGCDVWVKHENHLPTGAFKVRGGLWYIKNLCDSEPGVKGVIAATRGNHGQSVAFAAQKTGFKTCIVVPHGNNPDKNRSMLAYGAELIEYGEDFNDALDHARDMAQKRGLHLVPSFHKWLIQGVGTYSLELFSSVRQLDTVYVPIGLGSGICAMIAVRDALKLETEIVGVVAGNAPAYAISFANGKLVTTKSADTLADGLAVRVPNESALQTILHGAARIITVSEQEILDAIKYIFIDTHNIAEGAGASALAGLIKEQESMRNKKVAVILSGGNINQALYKTVI